MAYRAQDMAGDERHRVQQFTHSDATAAMTRRDVLRAFGEDPVFVGTFADTLVRAPFEAFFWETPPWSGSGLDLPYEHCLTDAPALAGVAPEPEPFRSHLRGGHPVATFSSLRGDASLIAPTPATGSYPHLATFVRTAPAATIVALFRAVALAIPARLDPRCWVSTSGLGVHWLHVRVDDRPKYYVHRRYR